MAATTQLLSEAEPQCSQRAEKGLKKTRIAVNNLQRKVAVPLFRAMRICVLAQNKRRSHEKVPEWKKPLSLWLECDDLCHGEFAHNSVRPINIRLMLF